MEPFRYYEGPIIPRRFNSSSVFALEIIDSRGNPTIQSGLILPNGEPLAISAVPSGASVGEHEALEMRDGDRSRHLGKGVKKAIASFYRLAQQLNGMDITDLQAIDQKMIDLDSTPNKSEYGANAILAMSLLVARMGAAYERKPLFLYLAEKFGTVDKLGYMPTPMINIFNGGVHTGWQSTDIQEFMVMPYGSGTFTEAVRWGAEIYHTLKSILKSRGYSTLVGDEGGFAASVSSNEEALLLILESIKKAGFKPGPEVGIALDPATSEWYDKRTHRYKMRKERRELDSDQLVAFWDSWVTQYPIISLEDGLEQDDWPAWQNMTGQLGSKIQIVGDDLLVTNPVRVKRAIETESANALLVKINQIGSLTEAAAAVQMCTDAGWGRVVSHRSGETDDPVLAELALALGTSQIKTGSMARGERTAKYNFLMQAENITLPKLEIIPEYAGKKPFERLSQSFLK